MQTKRFATTNVLVLLVAFLIAPVVAFAGGLINIPFLIADPSVDAILPAVAYNSQLKEYLVVWQNDRTANDDIYGQLVSASGSLRLPWFSIIAGTGFERQYPDVAYNSQHNEYLVTWLEDTLDIRGQRVGPNGGMIGVTLDLVLGSLGGSNCVYPFVAYSSSSDRYLLAFVYGDITSGYNVRAQSFQQDGTPDGSAFTIGNFTPPGLVTLLSGKPVDLAYNRERNEFLVAWQQYISGPPSRWEVNAQRVKMSGGAGKIGAVIPVCAIPTVSFTAPAVGVLPNPIGLGQYLVTCEESVGASDSTIHGRRFDGQGNPDMTDLVISADPNREYNMSAAGSLGGQEYMVVWVENNPPPFGFTSGVRGRLVPNQGLSMGEPVTIDLGTAAGTADVVGGAYGEFLTVFDNFNVSFGTTTNIWGQLWGNRLYLPVVVK